MTKELAHIDASKITFLADAPETLSARDDLNHKSLATRIISAVRNCPTPYTIGLSGEWGSGKTTVAQYIQEMLNQDKEIPVVFFDAWKYQRDTLRRQFLIESHKQLHEAGFLESNDLTDAELYETRSFQHSPETDWDEVVPWKSKHPLASWFRLVIFLAGCAAIGYAVVFPSSLATRLVSVLLGGIGIQAFIGLLPKLFLTGTPTDVKPPITSAEEFEKKFKGWLDSKKLKDHRLLVIVDNVDRCDDAQIIELLGDIKTFLEPRGSKVVFLLPVDEGAVRRALSDRYKSTDAANEFLRKFFNTLFRVPVPLSGETRSYATRKLKETGLLEAAGASGTETGRVITVIAAAYRNNPRRVIQFLNRLSSQWLLLASTAELLNRPAIAADLGAIAKGVAIRERWPDLASFLEDSPLELAKAEKDAVNGTEHFAIGPSGITAAADSGTSQFPDLARFLRATRTISLSRPRLVLTGKADLSELQLPDADLLRGYLRGEQQSAIAELIGTDAWAEANAAGHVSDFIRQELNDLSAAQELGGVGVLLSVVGPALPQIHESFRTDLADHLADRIGTPGVTEALAKVGPEAVIPIIQHSQTSRNNALSSLPQLMTQVDASRRPEFSKALAAHSEMLAPAKDQVLAQEAIRDDPLIIENLSLIGGKPNQFWNPDVVRNVCAKVVGGTDAAAFTRWLTPTRDLLQATADSGEDVHDLVLQLLNNETDPEDDVTFRWAARSPTLLQGTANPQDLDPLRLRAEVVRDKGGQFTKIEYLAFLARLKGFADSASLTTFTAELTAWMSTIPLDPSNELGDWFPDLKPWQFGLPAHLLTNPTGAFNETEGESRLRFARQQNMSWTEVGQELLQMLGTSTGMERATLLAQEAIAEHEGVVPDEFYPEVSNALLKQLYDGTTYQPSILPLLQQFYAHQDKIESKTQEGRLAFRKKLLEAMNGGTARALTDYHDLDFARPEVEEDVEAALNTLKSRSITSSSGTLLAFLVEKPPVRIRTELMNLLEILATDDTHWALGLEALDKTITPPSIQIAARVTETVARDAMLKRGSEPQRASKGLSTAIHLAKLAKDKAPRAEIAQTIEALRTSDVITPDQAEALKTRLSER